MGADDPNSQLTPARREALQATLEMLELVRQTPDKDYSIYFIP
jgi:hypothetical protein